MLRHARFLLLCCCVLPWSAVRADALLEYRLEGLDKAQRANVEAWLGALPESEAARSNFLSSARERVADSLKALGYYRADVDLTVDRSSSPWELLIAVTPGPPVMVEALDIQVMGDAQDDPAFQRLLAAPGLAVGDILHHGHYESLRNSLLQLGQRRGYFDARLLQRSVEVEPGANSARVRLHYASGDRYRVGKLRYAEDFVSPELLQSLSHFTSGEPYDVGALQTLQAELQRTGYFSGVTLRPLLEQRADGSVPLQLDLFPAKRHTVDVGIGYSTDTEERVSVTWKTPRINRHGHSQETRFEYSRINPSGQFTYNIPLTHPLEDMLQLSLRVEQNEYGDLDSNQHEAQVRRERRYGRWVLSYHLRALNERWDAATVEGDEDYLLPGFTVSHKSREGSPVNPDRGFSQFYEVEATSSQLGSSIDMTRLYANWVHVMPLGDRGRLVSRAEAGAALIGEGQRDDLAPSLSFFAGGSQSLRGYGYQSIGNTVPVMLRNGSEVDYVLGADRLALASLEYQYRFLPDWRAAVFVDGGDAFDEGEFEAVIGAGFGLHYLTPVGALKLEIANSVSEDNPDWRFHINIGAEF
ncbi:MAG: autotransporter assembly complex protein TamA [Halieaceae bacterium]|uniref:autotransporter assembly complex protein TamA n=1 Tax=Haliea alexandrii TaxID=2448162 RepID=UPI000F0B99E2|nr:autotransporter assembly complex family protein [Haliea alexandrii]MCR9184660.1 autotransporter assembly complex protein TamA [Halieaceae bacterium]